MYIYATNTHANVVCGFVIRKEHTNMTEEELKAKEAELNSKEEDLKKREEDVNGLVSKMTKEYEAKLKKQKEDYEKRLEEREKVINELLNGEGAVDNTPSAIEELNARRRAQRRG